MNGLGMSITSISHFYLYYITAVVMKASVDTVGLVE